MKKIKAKMSVGRGKAADRGRKIENYFQNSCSQTQPCVSEKSLFRLFAGETPLTCVMKGRQAAVKIYFFKKPLYAMKNKKSGNFFAKKDIAFAGIRCYNCYRISILMR